ncbi:viperin family antiviral radical SAM protein [Haloplasma contractile]|uniref:S-adenosylmethionine-dependent nucleotide dehydratase n=1 Tax=Haloplasma contractile SSD-17B TaxID=1033810 RepID=F7PTT0_9MOLU|nr:viperin family antiviral radical SAM protein [Haloplasma contractile]ERJ12243.1 Fe-S protein radical SAM family protein [Haloplasma contractile SSD-17B]
MKLSERKINYHYTSECDMNCKFCFRFYNKSNLKQILTTFHELCKKVKSINLVGGEVFLDIDLLLSLIHIARDHNVKLSLVTNGYILSKSLDDERVLRVLKHLSVIGISIDSFNPEYNRMVGRTVNHDVLSIEELKQIINVARKNDCLIKINTVVTKYNASENLMKTISTFNIDQWKQFKVVLYDQEQEEFHASDVAFNSFTKLNQTSYVTTERENELKHTYLNVIPNGDFIMNTGDQTPMSNIYKEVSLIEQELSTSKYDDEGYKSRYKKKSMDDVYIKA